MRGRQRWSSFEGASSSASSSARKHAERGRKRYRRVRIKELKRIECTLSKRRVEEGEGVFGVSFAFHTLAAIFDDRNHAGLSAESKSPSDQFLRPVSPMPGSASHYSGLNPRNSRYSSKNAARPVASCCTALRGISLSYVNQPFPCIPQITSAGHAIDWEAIGRACLQAGRTPLSDNMALYTTSNILRDSWGVHDK